MRIRISALLIMILMAIFIIGACSSGGGSKEKKPSEQKAQETTSDQTSTTGQTDASGATGETQTPATTETGATTTTQEGMTVVQEDGTVKVYDAQGNLVKSSETTPSVAPGETQTGLSGSSQPSTQPDASKQEIKTRGDVNITNKIAIIKTNFGDVYVFFYPDIAPTHVRNFIYLAQKGFYKNVKFHRIVKDFMAQAGIPRPDWTEAVPAMPLEARAGSVALHFPGALSAARTSDPNSATSQFFLVFKREKAKHLDGQYTVFGQTFKGFDVLEKLSNVKCEQNPDKPDEISKPIQDVHIVDVVIEDATKYQEEINKVMAENAKILEKERGA